jgi:uncharacterized protein (TIGR02452 family)
MDRELAATLGHETVAILRAGRYTSPSGHDVDLRAALDACRDATVEYPPEHQLPLPAPGLRETQISVANDTVLAVGRRIAREAPVAALNFASATSPGGGFLSGARAQEESIARSSGLLTALEDCDMYDYHRGKRDAMYSDYVIYSPDVPVFRTDAGELLEEPWACSIITSPAVHAHAVREYTPAREAQIPGVMRARTAKVLSVAAAHGVRRLILGAWGCGAFGGDPEVMATIFRDALSGPLRGVFDEVVFAVTDWSAERRFIDPFRRAFEGE